MPRQYEILVTHANGECPALPAGLQYHPAGEYCSWKCPVHLVFQEACDISKARTMIKKLKQTQNISRINLYFGGERKHNDCYQYDQFAERWKRTY